MSAEQKRSEEREPRVPLYVQVLTEPAVHELWAINISPSGIGLVAPGRDQPDRPREGEVIGLELALPGISERLRARGTVTWRYDTPGAGESEAGLSLGVRFTELSDEDRLRLARYCHSYRYRVLVAYASADEEAALLETLGDEVNLTIAADRRELAAGLERGDVSAMVLCGDDADRADAAVELTRSTTRPGELAGVGASQDLAPRVVHCAEADPEQLVAQFDAGKLFRRIPPPIDAQAVHDAVIQACGDYGVRTEQRRVALALERALLRERARGRSREQLDAIVEERMVQESDAMGEVLEALRTVAPHKVSVLLQGETGVGKEVLAHLLHDLGDRTDAPFVVQDCGALTESLLESELFGHVKGAFTGAVANNPGLFVIADGGTILLDEIENTSANLQTKLLRVIETGEVRPVGGSQVRYVDVRIIAASNRDLSEEMEAGRFRADLYYRLSTFPVTVPPLRERPEDVLPLAEHFLKLSGHRLGHRAGALTAAARRALQSYRWPGNVRELRNVIERAVLLAGADGPVDAHLFPATLRGEEMAEPGAGGLRAQLARVERQAIEEALKRHGGVVRRAARELDMNPVTLARRARKLGLLDED